MKNISISVGHNMKDGKIKEIYAETMVLFIISQKLYPKRY